LGADSVILFSPSNSALVFSLGIILKTRTVYASRRPSVLPSGIDTSSI
jgi:hypothetical protein